MPTSPTPNLDDLFAEMSQEADQSGLSLDEKALELPPGPSRLVSDRLARLFLNGFLPLWLLMFVVCWACAGMSNPFVLLGAVSLAVPAAWFLAPLTRSGYRLGGTRLLAAAPLVLLFSLACAFLPRMLEFSLEGHPWHEELLSLVLQEELESLFRWPSLALIGLAYGIVLFASLWVKGSFPWVDVEPVGRARRIGIWATLGTVLVLGAGWFVAGTSLSSEAVRWRKETQELYQARPFVGLPEQSATSAWQDRFERIRQGGVDEEAISLELESFTSQEELRYAAGYLLWRLAQTEPGPAQLNLAFDRIKLHLMRRPSNERVYAENDLHSKLIPQLASVPLTVEQLETLLQTVRELHALALRGDRLREADLVAYHYLWSGEHNGDVGVAEPGFRWYHSRPEELKDPKTGQVIGTVPLFRESVGRQPDYRVTLKARDLRVLGATVSWSPTRSRDQRRRAQLTQEWMEVRQASSPEELESRILEKHRQVLERSLAGQFWAELSAQDRVRKEAPLLEAAELVAVLRLHRARHGAYPSSLQAVADQVRLGQDLQERYDWRSVSDGWVLEKGDLSVAFPSEASR